MKMKNIMMITAAFALSATMSVAQNASTQINNLPNSATKTALIELNNEDQRLVSGQFDANTNTLRLQTQDMKAGADNNISRREVVIGGFESLKGAKGDKGDQGVAGAKGAKGDKGDQGVAGVDGKDFDTAAYDQKLAALSDRHKAQAAVAAAIGGLEMRTPGAGSTTWALGISGIDDGDFSTAFSGGIRHGVSNKTSIYGKVSHSFEEDITGVFLGIEGQF